MEILCLTSWRKPHIDAVTEFFHLLFVTQLAQRKHRHLCQVRLRGAFGTTPVQFQCAFFISLVLLWYFFGISLVFLWICTNEIPKKYRKNTIDRPMIFRNHYGSTTKVHRRHTGNVFNTGSCCKDTLRRGFS